MTDGSHTLKVECLALWQILETISSDLVAYNAQQASIIATKERNRNQDTLTCECCGCSDNHASVIYNSIMFISWHKHIINTAGNPLTRYHINTPNTRSRPV